MAETTHDRLETDLSGGALDFRILGPLEVLDVDQRPLALGGQKQRAVLGLLLLERGRVVPTEVLVDRLWGEDRRRPRSRRSRTRSPASGSCSAPNG